MPAVQVLVKSQLVMNNVINAGTIFLWFPKSHLCNTTALPFFSVFYIISRSRPTVIVWGEWSRLVLSSYQTLLPK